MKWVRALLYTLDHNQSERLLLNNSLRYKQQIGIVKLDASVSSISIDKQDDFNYQYRYSAPGQDFSADSLTNEQKVDDGALGNL